jgi:hypothetical protein
MRKFFTPFTWTKAAILGIIVFAVLEVISLPAVFQQHNPPVVQEPAWDSPATRELAKRACFDCHSNEVVWPWYAKTTPAAWLVVHDVQEGREELNFSDWQNFSEDGDEMAEVIIEGEMPPWFYLPLHPEANLSAAEQQQLIAGLRQLGGGGEGGEGYEEYEEEEHE